MAAAPGDSLPGKAPVELTNVQSESMVYDSVARKITFSGQVVVTHPDFIMTSDRLLLLLNENDKPGADVLNAGAVRCIVAESGVEIRLPDGKNASCAQATYEAEAEILLMEGNPVLRDGASQVRGERIIFYLREDRNEALGGVTVDFSSQVRATDGS